MISLPVLETWLSVQYSTVPATIKIGTISYAKRPIKSYQSLFLVWHRATNEDQGDDMTRAKTEMTTTNQMMTLLLLTLAFLNSASGQNHHRTQVSLVYSV